MKFSKRTTTRAIALVLVLLLLVGSFAALAMPDEAAGEYSSTDAYQATETEGADSRSPESAEEDEEFSPEEESSPSNGSLVENPDDEFTVIEIEDDDGNEYQFMVPSHALSASNVGSVQFVNRNQWIPVPSAWHFAGQPLSVGFYQIRINGVYYPAYCLQPRVPAPPTGNYAYNVLAQNTLLARGLYYSFGAPGQRYYLDTLTNLPLPTSSHTGSRLGDAQYLLSHLTLSIIYQGQWPPLLTGINQTGRNAAFAFRDWLETAPHPPHANKSFSNANVQATINVGGARQETPEITFNADPRNAIMVDPSAFGQGVILLRTRDGGEPTFHWSATEIRGGDSFHFRVPLTAAVPGTHTSDHLHGTQTRHWYAILFNQGAAHTQTIGGWSQAFDPVAPIQLSVTWLSSEPETAGLVIAKTSETGRNLGVDFRLQGLDATNNHIDMTVTTDTVGADGITGASILRDLPVGRYRVSEINVPGQYIQLEPQYITLIAGLLWENRLEFHNELVRGRVQGIKLGVDPLRP